MKKNEKYIVYLHREYMDRYCQAQGIETLEERENVRRQIFDIVSRFLRGEVTQSVFMTETFVNSKGEETKAVEIYRLSNGTKIKNLRELKQLMGKQKKRGYVELKK